MILLISLAGLSPIRIKSRSNSSIDATQMLCGLFFLTIIYSLLSLIGLIRNQLITGSIFTLIIVSLVYEIYRRKKNFWKILTRGSKLTIFLSLSISAALQIIGYKKFMTHMNPDPYGYMALSGALMKYGSIHEIMSKWSEFTGQIYTQGLNWDLPTKFLPNAWLVPDMVIRYAVDEVVNGQRIGFSSLLVPGMQLFNPISFFLICWLALSIVGLAMLSGSLYDLALREKSKLKKIESTLKDSELRINSKSRTSSNSQVVSIKSPRDFYYLSIIALTISPIWGLVFIFEGLSSQLCTAAAIVAVFTLCIDLQENGYRENRIKIVLILMICLGAYFIYVQQLPMILLAGISPFIVQLFKVKRLAVWVKALAVFVMLCVTYFSLQFTSLKTYFELVVGSSGHGSIHLGSVNPVTAQFSGIDTFWNSPSSLPRTQALMFKNFMDSGLGIPTTRSNQIYGYVILESSFYEQMALIVGAFILLMLTVVFLQRKGFSFALTSSLIPLGIWCSLLVYYLFSHVYLVFYYAKDGNQERELPPPFSDYVWLRLISVFSIYLLILLSLVIGRVNFSKFTKKIISSVVVCIFLFSLFSFIKVAIQFQKVSYPGSVAVSCDELSEFNDPIYVYQHDQGSQAVQAITLCGEKLLSFSDPFPAKLVADGQRHDVIDLVLNPKLKSWELIKRGSFAMTQDIQTPCDYVCIQRLPDFQKR